MSELERQYKKFIEWYNEQLENKIQPYMTKKEIKELIKKITKYYETKYSAEVITEQEELEEEFLNEFLISEPNLALLSEFPKSTFEQTIGLTPKETIFLNNKFRGASCEKIQNNGITKTRYFVTIPIKNNPTLGPKIYFDEFGTVYPNDISNLRSIFKNFNDKITLRQIYETIKEQQPDAFNYEQLEQLVVDMELKQWFKYLTIQKLNSNYTDGYSRTKQFAKDFNQFYQSKINIANLKYLKYPPRDCPNDLRPIYNEYLDQFEKTGERPHPDKLLALLMLQVKFWCKDKANDKKRSIMVAKDEFYNFYKDEINWEINKIMKDFEFTKEDIIKYIEESGHIYEEEYYEEDKIWQVFYNGWSALRWALIYHPKYTLRETYEEYLPRLHKETTTKEKIKQRKRTLPPQL